jgi:hypothetical protein
MKDPIIDYSERMIMMSYLIGSLRGLLFELKPHLTDEKKDMLKQIDKKIGFLYYPSVLYNVPEKEKK